MAKKESTKTRPAKTIEKLTDADLNTYNKDFAPKPSATLTVLKVNYKYIMTFAFTIMFTSIGKRFYNIQLPLNVEMREDSGRNFAVSSSDRQS